MSLPFVKYCEIKDKYCLVYLGSSKEYLVQLRLLIPQIEEQIKGIEIHVCCRDEYINILKSDKTLPYSQINFNQNKFAHIRELKYNTETREHPILSLIKESSIEIKPIINKENNKSKKCKIVSTGILPIQNINSIDNIKTKAANMGFVVSEEDYKNAELVIGVESEEVFESAAMGKRTILIESGVGTELFKKMFPLCEIWKNC